MSESDKNQNANTENTPASNNEEQAYVEKKVYQQVSADMLKYKNELKEYKAKFEQIKADNEAKEKQSLHEQEKWKELYQKNEEKLHQLMSERDSERNKFISSHKINAVVQELGGFKKPEYTKFINVENIQLTDDGDIIPETISNEVARIKKEFPELVKVADIKPLPSNAPKFVEKDISQMTPAELNALRRELLKKK